MSIHPLQAFRARQRPPLTRQGLADLIGVREATVWRWETGARKIEHALLALVVEKTGIPATELRPDLVRLLLNPESERAAS